MSYDTIKSILVLLALVVAAYWPGRELLARQRGIRE